MHESENIHLMPMKGTVERETLRKAVEARRTRLVVTAMETGFNIMGDYVSQPVPEPPEAA